MAINYKTFSICGKYIIRHTREKYIKSASGRTWQKKPIETEEKTVTNEYYNNFVKSIPWFHSRYECRYTYAGYIPVRITSVSPDNSVKYVDKFSFDIIR